MMIKEDVIEKYGIPRFTIGSGGSGGATQQHLIAHNSAGLLDALTPGIPYPDVMSIVPDVLDCKLFKPGVKQDPLEDTWLSFGPAGAADYDQGGDEEDD